MNSHARVSTRLARMAVVVALALVFAGSAWGQAGKSLIVNHFANDPSTIETHIVVADVAGSGGQVSFMFYDDNGSVRGSGKETLPPKGKLNVDPNKYVKGLKMTGTVRISASSPISGQYWQFYNDAKNGWKNIVVPAGVAPGFTKLVCQHFVADKDIESYIVLADAQGTGGGAFIELFSDAGDLVGQQRVDIPKNGKVSIKPFEAVANRKMTGVAYIQTEGGKITGEYWQASGKEKYQIAHALQGSAPEADDMLNDKIVRIIVNFDFNSAKIQKRSHADLMEVAKAMNDPKNKSAKYEVGGHTDNVGKDDVNQKLSESRAKSVKDFLVKQGKVKADRLTTVGYGSKQPLVSNDTKANQAINRRVEFKKL